MDFDKLVALIQGHFTDGLAIVVGTGLAIAEGVPGMPELADHLQKNSVSLTGALAAEWAPIGSYLLAGEGLEAVLLRIGPTAALEAWIVRETANLLLPKERRVIQDVFQGKRKLRLTDFLSRILVSDNGLPIITTNYDRLVEVACESAGLHVDTLAVGQYAASFDPGKSFLAACKGIYTRNKATYLDYFQRAIVLKPHGSLDWFQQELNPRRCFVDLDLDRLIVTPGLNKYRTGYQEPFDMHRERANQFIDRSNRLFIIGYGFNDDHLQTHLVKKIQEGIQTIILTYEPTDSALEVIRQGNNCVCLSKSPHGSGVRVITKSNDVNYGDKPWWDLGVFTKEFLV